MKNALVTLILGLVFALPASAQQMLIEKNGYENEIISLDNLKQITFNGTTVNIEQADGTESSTSMEDISRIYFGDFSSIGNISGQSNLVDYVSSDGIAVNSPAGTTVTIYSVTGTQMLTARLETEGGYISTAGIPQGVYIIKADEQTAKFIRR